MHRSTTWRRDHQLTTRGARRWAPPPEPKHAAPRWPDLRLAPLPDWQWSAACAGDLSPEWITDRPVLFRHLVDRCHACGVLEQCAEWATAEKLTGIAAGARYIGGRRMGPQLVDHHEAAS